MRARKKFVVIAYDISLAKRRRRVVNAVMKYGGRINLSVFECMLTDAQLVKLKTEIGGMLDAATDQVAYYILCVDCFAAIEYQPKRKTADSGSPTTIV